MRAIVHTNKQEKVFAPRRKSFVNRSESHSTPYDELPEERPKSGQRVREENETVEEGPDAQKGEKHKRGYAHRGTQIMCARAGVQQG
jgi:hypothetical protein